YNNDIPQNAQLLSHPTGEFTLIGSLDGDGGWRFKDLDIALPEERDEATPHPYDVDDYWQDWYAMPLFASQTLVLEHAIFSDIATYVRLYDWDGNWMDSYGYESEQDTGVGSRGTTLKAMRFTAPAAGVYYICVLASDEDSAGNYELKFTNATRGALGGVNIIGHYDSARTGNFTTMLTADAHIAVDYNGIGAVVVSGDTYDTVVKTYRGGDIVCFQAGTVGQIVNTYYQTNYIISEGNIGRVAATGQGGWTGAAGAATVGFLSANIEAGAFGGTYNRNAHIQNIYAASDIVTGTIARATGSIGVVEAERHLVDSHGLRAIHGAAFRVNTDGIGPAGHIDLFDVGYDWSSPVITTGVDGNVGYISVGGVIFNWRLDWSGPAEPVTITNGTASTLYDDGGGQVTITPIPVPVDLVDNNDPTVLVPDGIQDVDPVTYMPVYYRASYSYLVIGINDIYDGGTGGVIANVTADGPVSFNTTGDVEINNLDISWFWNEPDPTNPDPSRPLDISVNFGGSGEANIYYLHDHHASQEGNFNSVSLSTSGNLVSGHMAYTPISQLKLGGNLGPLAGHTGAWIHGRDDAPLIPDPDDMDVEPRFGWFHGTVNGLAMGEMNGIGDSWIGINKVVADGAIGDLRVMGTIGTIRANADKITYFGNWDGIMGLVWSDTRLDRIYVGDGLLDDGGGDKAKAAILSSGFIGLVSIEGPYYVQEPSPFADLDKRLAGGMAFGLLNGSIIGRLNGYGWTVLDGDGNPAVDIYGNTTAQDYDAVHRVIGTKGAVLTANVLGFGLDSFWALKTSFTVTGGVGTVDFSGPGAKIDGSEIAGWYVRKVSTSVDSEGIDWSHISGDISFSGAGVVIGEILAGGPGMRNTNVVLTGGSIGTVRGIGPVADLYRCVFVGGAGMKYLGFRDINTNGIHMPGVVETIHAWRDMSFNDVGSGANYGAYVGAIKRLTVGRDFVMNGLHVASELTMDVKGNFTDSTITMYGSSSQLQSLTVDGDISGQIQCAGRIGSIISKNGQISADIITLNDDGDVGLLQAAGGFAGDVTVGGSLSRMISYTSLGNNPATHNGLTQYISIGGDLDYVRAVGSKTTSSHLYADFAVGGNIGTIDVDGTFYSNVTTNGDLKKLILDGALGGNLGGTVGDRGSLTVFGTVGQMKFNTNSDLVADLCIGGSINKIALKNSSIRGNIESRFGSIKQIDVNGGSILGTLTARSIGKVRVNGGSISGDV
ncbi:MAG: hypothetical protein KAX78_10200, partial [Phycisphaerae bacterium]|nr:hypothetical protein [Phycisphaerae bacterium]